MWSVAYAQIVSIHLKIKIKRKLKVCKNAKLSLRLLFEIIYILDMMTLVFIISKVNEHI